MHWFVDLMVYGTLLIVFGVPLFALMKGVG